ncbi:MAG: hypothetical protein ACI8ZM_005152 [Crocinitomix sp.]|jgi:hypothetical protein
MKLKQTFTFLITALFMVSCGGSGSNADSEATDSTALNSDLMISDSVLLSFAFVGCNRIDRKDTANWAATDSSSANLSVLKRVMHEVMELDRQPDLFFFLGDIVLAETNLLRLNTELENWVKLYNDTSQTGPMSANPSIEMVAVPGNHEMLTYKKYKDAPLHSEFPLAGSTESWMHYMKDFMPSDRDYITGPDSVNNQMTFSFVRGNVAFIMMNTDTYNGPSQTYPHGREGMIAYDWITTKTEEYQNNPTIDHVFVMGHKPAYTESKADPTLHFDTIHAGFMHSEELWLELMDDTVVAMLSAHAHTYSRNQPMGHGTYQVIAGNGGSKDPEFYGYTLVNIMSSGEVQLISKGFENDGEYYYNPKSAADSNYTVTQDSTILIWDKNATSVEAAYKQ